MIVVPSLLTMVGSSYGAWSSRIGESDASIATSWNADCRRTDYGCAHYTNDMQFRFPIGEDALKEAEESS